MFGPEVIRCLIDEWLAHRDAAANLLVQHLNLDSPRDILKSEHRGHRELIGTGWKYRTHGIGVDVTRADGQGGIDFDFSTKQGELFAPPDHWRLQLFAKRLVRDKPGDSMKYAPIAECAEEHRDAIDRIIAERFAQ